MERLCEFADGNVIHKGRTYYGTNGATILFDGYYFDESVGEWLHYKAKHPEFDNDEWVSSDIRPSVAHAWIDWQKS